MLSIFFNMTNLYSDKVSLHIIRCGCVRVCVCVCMGERGKEGNHSTIVMNRS